MTNITRPEELNNLENNKFVGTLPKMNNSTICFRGQNNVLYCEDGVELVNSSIEFNADNAICFLSCNKHPYKINVSVNNNNVFYMGSDNYINGNVHIVLSEEKHLFVGNDCLFSFGIWIRNADPHLIYDCNNMKRINPTKSIYIGDHVWLGQSAMILKGTQICSGCIIGAMSVVSGKRISSNSLYAGNPAKKIKENIFWDGKCVHKWNKKTTDNNLIYKSNDFIYNYVPNEYIAFDDIENKLSSIVTAEKKLEYLLTLRENKSKNRFTSPHNKEIKKRKKIFGIF